MALELSNQDLAVSQFKHEFDTMQEVLNDAKKYELNGDKDIAIAMLIALSEYIDNFTDKL